MALGASVTLEMRKSAHKGLRIVIGLGVRSPDAISAGCRMKPRGLAESATFRGNLASH